MKKPIVIVGIVAVAIAIGALVMMQPAPQQENPMVAQLQQEAERYATQIDSMNTEIDNFNQRIDAIRAQRDSSQKSNQILVASLQKVTSELKEYQKLYSEQRALNQKLQTQLAQAEADKADMAESLESLRSEMAKKDEELLDREIRIQRLEASLQASQQREQDAVKREEKAVKMVSQVFVHTGKQKALEQSGYLQVRPKTIFTNSYKVVKFPDEMSQQVIKADIGGGLLVHGKVNFLADRHGKLKRGREYDLNDKGDDNYEIIFKEPTLEGQRILVVMN